MTEEKRDVTTVEALAALVAGTAKSSYVGVSVQRSHRFPVHLFFQIENLAQMGGVPVSLIINELIECGLDALKKELTEEERQRVLRISEKQRQRPTVSDRIEGTGRKYRRSNSGQKK